MNSRHWWRMVPLFVLVLGVTACGQGGDKITEAETPAATTEETAPAGQAAGTPTVVAGWGTPRVASGAMERGPTLTPPARPTFVGQRRYVPISEAIDLVPFELLEPKELPPDTNRDVVQVELPPRGQTVEGLPGVRFIYTVGGGGALIVYQSPATGAEATGEPVDINGHPGWLATTEDGGAILVEWEADDVRYQVRGNGLDREVVLAAARSMEPVSPAE